MYVPSNRELADNITDKVISVFAEIAFIAPSGSYELRNSLDLVDFFDKIDKTSYGALQSFVKYCNNSIRYYKNDKVIILLKDVITSVNRFIRNYDIFLH